MADKVLQVDVLYADRDKNPLPFVQVVVRGDAGLLVQRARRVAGAIYGWYDDQGGEHDASGLFYLAFMVWVNPRQDEWELTARFQPYDSVEESFVWQKLGD